MADDEKLWLLKDTIVKFVQLGEYQQAYELIDELAAQSESGDELKKALDEQRKKNDDLEQQLQQMQEPPLFEAVLIGRAPDNPDHVIIGQGSQRMEVLVAGDADIRAEDFVPGAEVWLNGDRQIIKVRPVPTGGEIADVVNVIGDKIEVKVHSGESVLLDVGEQIDLASIRGGDRLRISSALRMAFEKLPVQENQELRLEELPTERYRDIGGLDDSIQEIREAIQYPYLYGRLYRRYNLQRPKGILLYGPPGNGKTMIAKAIANELSIDIEHNLKLVAQSLELLILWRDQPDEEHGPQQFYDWWQAVHAGQNGLPPADLAPDEMRAEIADFLDMRGVSLDDPDAELARTQKYIADGSQAYFISIKGPELLNKYVGETEHSIRKLFQQAKNRASVNTPVVMFFDEIEALFRRRGSRMSSDVESTIVPQFLSEIDGVENLRDVIIIGATNRQDLLDPAISRPGRLDIKIKIDRPNADAARAIIGKHLSPNLPYDPDELEQAGSVENLVHQFIERAVAILYNEDESYIYIEGHNISGTGQKFPLTQFASGAILANIVQQAKKRALKRQIEMSGSGIAWEDMRVSIRAEFEQSKDQLAAQLLEIPEDKLSIIEVYIAKGEEIIRADVGPWLQRPKRDWELSMLAEMNVNVQPE